MWAMMSLPCLVVPRIASFQVGFSLREVLFVFGYDGAAPSVSPLFDLRMMLVVRDGNTKVICVNHGQDGQDERIS